LVFVTLMIFMKLGMYRAVMRFLGTEFVLAVVKGVTISALVLAASVFIFRLEGFPRTVIFIYWMIALIYVGGSRFFVRSFLIHSRRQGSKKLAAIYGAGEAGHKLSVMLSHNADISPVCFIDDNMSLSGSQINGLRVYHSSELDTLIDALEIDQILLALPNVSRNRRKQIVDLLENHPVHIYTIPAIADIVSGRANVDDIREVEIEDLLGREPVPANEQLLHACVMGKVVMVTGAGGSIGSELCRQIIELKPRKLILFEISEFALYQIEQEIKSIISASGSGITCELVALLGDIKDKKRISKIVSYFSIQTIYHAAAYKHVPMVEKNILEGVRNNILGTYTAAQAAIEGGVETFVLISTDKAVRPTNVMGATKRFAELVLQGLAIQQSKTRFCMVRFGNVLGSSGSVIPVFRNQIAKGGPVTITHPDIVRYFMTIPEAAELVIQAGSMGKGGDVFVLDMGQPVKITDLANKLIHLSGLTVRNESNPDGDIRIEFTGLRPGEKLYEELLIGDNVAGTEHMMILSAQEVSLGEIELKNYIVALKDAIEHNDVIKMKEILQQAVAGYIPDENIVDYLHPIGDSKNSKLSIINTQ